MDNNFDTAETCTARLSIRPSTKELFKKLGGKRETEDDILIKLIKYYAGKHKINLDGDNNANKP
jgi:acyl-CoA-binding protein